MTPNTKKDEKKADPNAKVKVICTKEGWLHAGKPVEVGAEVEVKASQLDRLENAKLAKKA